MKERCKVVIIGGGSAGIYLATLLDHSIHKITIVEGQKTIGRKFLVAGKGGFNLSHSLPVEDMINKYDPVDFMKSYISNYPASALVKYFKDLGVETYVGTSGKIFPAEGLKPIDVLNAIRKKLNEKGVKIITYTRWKNTLPDFLEVMKEGESHLLPYDIVVYALGGASWKKTGSDGSWLEVFQQMGIKVRAFQGSNCGVLVSWTESFLKVWEGAPVKNITLKCDHRVEKGEVVITSRGIEGSPVYALNGCLRKQNTLPMTLTLNLIPSVSKKKLQSFMKGLKSSKSLGSLLKNTLELSPVKLALVKELIDKETYHDRSGIISALQSCRIRVDGFNPMDEAISTVGGVLLEEVDHNLMLKCHPHQYVIGEMLDWDAPTGGFLLQACFSMAAQLATHLNSKNG
jgi:uncharacterized flavoprotein (TIGR03862 family)